MSTVSEIMDQVTRRDPNQPEFHQAVAEVAESIAPALDRHIELRTAKVFERLVEPERVLQFRVPWVDDRGEVQVNRGFRVEFNSAIGPYKGGLRFHPSVNLSILKFLGFEQVFKNALTTLPLGGGKGGSDFDPKGKSDAEAMRFCQSFMSELFRHIGPNTDIPAGDIGVGGREIGYLFGQYKRLRNEFTGVLTGKSLGWGGSLIRPEATGYGAVYFAQELLAGRGETIKGKTVTISGYGNVGTFIVEKVNQLGGKVVTLSDEYGYVHDPDGIKGEKLAFLSSLWTVHRESAQRYAERFGCDWFPDRRPWDVPCDVCIPSATQNEIEAADAQALVDNGVTVVCEAANMPCTPDAIAIFLQHQIAFGPAKAANAGGVTVSALEMSQNSMRLAWPREEVERRLHDIMKAIHRNCATTAADYGMPGNLAAGANIAGFMKVAQAMMDQGVV